MGDGSPSGDTLVGMNDGNRRRSESPPTGHGRTERRQPRCESSTPNRCADPALWTRTNGANSADRVARRTATLVEGESGHRSPAASLSTVRVEVARISAIASRVTPTVATNAIPIEPVGCQLLHPNLSATVLRMGAGEFTIEFFEDDDGGSPVEEWMESDLTDIELAALLAGLQHVLSHRGIDVCRTEWGKQLGEGLFEFRIRHTAAEIERMFADSSDAQQAKKERVLLRVFCHAYGAKIVMLLNGYDKGGDSSGKRQQREIALARRRLDEFKARQARERKKQRRGGHH